MTLTISCPQCGGPVLRVHSPAEDVEVFRCLEHGVFHFGASRDVTDGPPGGETRFARDSEPRQSEDGAEIGRNGGSATEEIAPARVVAPS